MNIGGRGGVRAGVLDQASRPCVESQQKRALGRIALQRIGDHAQCLCGAVTEVGPVQLFAAPGDRHCL